MDPASKLLPVILGLAMVLCGHGSGAGEKAATSRTVRGVVELFTSQGCHSCPPAEKILTTMADDTGIVALAYHVDYWDYIGWPDPYGSSANTERQRAYAKTFKTGTIYTPQAVVNGNRDIVGSRTEAIETALRETALTDLQSKVWVGLGLQGDRLHISADGDRERMAAREPVLMLVTFDGRSETAVEKGENAGLTLLSTHAVRDWRVLGIWDGEPLEIDIPVSTLKPAAGGRIGCAALLQSVTETGTPGAILAAAALDSCG